MSNQEELRRLVISAIHGMDYNEAIKRESVSTQCECWYKLKSGEELVGTTYKIFSRGLEDKVIETEILGLPITVGRVLIAITNKQGGMGLLSTETDSRRMFFRFNENCYWELTKPNGREAELSDQSEETIEKLLQIFKAE